MRWEKSVEQVAEFGVSANQNALSSVNNGIQNFFCSALGTGACDSRKLQLEGLRCVCHAADIAHSGLVNKARTNSARMYAKHADWV
jgi:hypothetical protein